MLLYTSSRAPNPRRLQLFMAEKGIAIPSVQVDLAAGEQFHDPLRSVNPLCTVPALVTDEGPVLSQVDAICEYLEARFPEPPLLGCTPIERALVREWSHRIFCEGLLPIADVLRNSNPAFANRALPGPVDVAQIPALAERGNRLVDAFFIALERRLGEQEHIAGPAFSKADIDAFVACEFAGWIRRLIPADCHHLRCWQQRIGARPVVRQIETGDGHSRSR